MAPINYRFFIRNGGLCSREPQRFHRLLQPFPIVFPIDPWIVYEEFDHGRTAIEYSTDEFQADDVAVKAQRLFQVAYIKNDMSQGNHWLILSFIDYTYWQDKPHNIDSAMPGYPQRQRYL